MVDLNLNLKGEMMKTNIIFAASLFSGIASAAPFLTSDPMCYDVTGARSECPASCEYSDDGETTWFDLPTTISGDQITVWHDLSLLTPGTHAWAIRCVNVWGKGDAVPFDFTAGVPVSPFGLRVVAP